jgi:Response regulator containing CheY-like receiver, AAA-type ATPase, and DNA-binding domains
MSLPQPYMILIDDDEDDLEMFSSELEMKGLKVKTFDSSAKALIFLTLMSGNNELPSLIILDYNMPKRNGQQFLLSIKADKDTKDIPVVIYSTGMNDLLKAGLLKAGAFNCFDKPWNGKELNIQIDIFEKLYSLFTRKSHRNLDIGISLSQILQS